MDNITITRKGNEIIIHSHFSNQTYKAYYENGILKAKKPLHLRMAVKALNLETLEQMRNNNQAF